MRRYIPLIDLLLFTALGALALGSLILVVFTAQDWPTGKIVTVSVVPLAIVAVCAWALLVRWLARPAFITKQGTAVWVAPTGPLLSEIEEFLDFYIEHVAELWPQATEYKIKEMLSGARIEFVNRLITLGGFGWSIKDAYGLQKGKIIKVKYNTCHLENTALCHELHHMIDELVFNVPPDYQHKLTVWWYTCSIINASWGQRNSLQKRSLNVHLPKSF